MTIRITIKNEDADRVVLVTRSGSDIAIPALHPGGFGQFHIWEGADLVLSETEPRLPFSECAPVWIDGTDGPQWCILVNGLWTAIARAGIAQPGQPGPQEGSND